MRAAGRSQRFLTQVGCYNMAMDGLCRARVGVGVETKPDWRLTYRRMDDATEADTQQVVLFGGPEPTNLDLFKPHVRIPCPEPPKQET